MLDSARPRRVIRRSRHSRRHARDGAPSSASRCGCRGPACRSPISPTMADEAHAIRRLLDNNPRDISQDEILALYRDRVLTRGEGLDDRQCRSDRRVLRRR